MTGTVISEQCHPRFDAATHQSETRCDAAVRYLTSTGRVITTTVTDAFPFEFRHTPGKPATIRLRYDSNDPAHPYKQSNYMSLGPFLLLLGIGAPAAACGGWWHVPAERIAENTVRRRARYP